MPKNIHPPVGEFSRPTSEAGTKLKKRIKNPARSGTPPFVIVEILKPQDGSEVISGTVRLRASASEGSENLSKRVRWTSSIDGFLGRGRVVNAELSPGEHTLSASIRRPAGTAKKATTAVTARVTLNVSDSTQDDTSASDPTNYGSGSASDPTSSGGSGDSDPTDCGEDNASDPTNYGYGGTSDSADCGGDSASDPTNYGYGGDAPSDSADCGDDSASDPTNYGYGGDSDSTDCGDDNASDPTNYGYGGGNS